MVLQIIMFFYLFRFWKILENFFDKYTSIFDIRIIKKDTNITQLSIYVWIIQMPGILI